MRQAPERLFTYDFVVLGLAATFGFCNIAVFYGFVSYLERLGIDPAWRGPLLSAEPLAAFCLRPFLSALVTPRNALALARGALLTLGVALLSYQFARGVPAIMAVRLLHGVAFVGLVSAATVLLAHIIPRERAGRAFGYFSLTSQVPYALLPPLTEWLLPRLGGEDLVYAFCSLLVLPGLILLAPLGRRLGGGGRGPAPAGARPSLAELRRDLALPPVLLLLLATLCLFWSTTLVFFFMKPFTVGLGLKDPGLFFTVSTTASIAMRVVAGPLYDRLPKELLLVAALAGLAGCMLGFAATSTDRGLLGLAALYGACLGVALPVANAVMFSRSPAPLRGVNLNLMMFMMDLGYVAGPAMGGGLLAAGLGYPLLFLACAAFAAAAGLLLLPLAPGAGGAGKRNGPRRQAADDGGNATRRRP